MKVDRGQCGIEGTETNTIDSTRPPAGSNLHKFTTFQRQGRAVEIYNPSSSSFSFSFSFSYCWNRLPSSSGSSSSYSNTTRFSSLRFSIFRSFVLSSTLQPPSVSSSFFFFLLFFFLFGSSSSSPSLSSSSSYSTFALTLSKTEPQPWAKAAHCTLTGCRGLLSIWLQTLAAASPPPFGPPSHPVYLSAATSTTLDGAEAATLAPRVVRPHHHYAKNKRTSKS